MLTLSLLRHAKSSWAEPSQDDFDRPLNERGIEAAPAMGKFMAAQKLVPDLILCSTAVRARETLELVRPHLPRATMVEYEDGLYLAATPVLLKRVRAVAADVGHLMLVGHDPGMHGLATKLAGVGRSGAAGCACGQVSDRGTCGHRIRCEGLEGHQAGRGAPQGLHVAQATALTCAIGLS